MKKYLIVLFIAAFTWIALPGCGDEEKVKDMLSETNVDTDGLFLIRFAVESGHAEIGFAKQAQKKATDPKVKAFAEMMLRDHMKADSELSRLATKKLVTLGVTPAQHHLEASKQLDKLSGNEFDKQYMRQMILDHQKAVKVFSEESRNRDAAVRQYAQKYLPVMKMHLDEAQKLSATLK